MTKATATATKATATATATAAQAENLQAEVIRFASEGQKLVDWLSEHGFFKGEKPNFFERCSELGIFPKGAMKPNSILRAIRRGQENVIVRDFIIKSDIIPEAEGFSLIAMSEKYKDHEKFTEFSLSAITQKWVTVGGKEVTFQGPLDLVKGVDILERTFRREMTKRKPEEPEKTPEEIAEEIAEKREKAAQNAREVADMQIANIREANARLLQKSKSQQSRLNSLLLIVETMSDTVTQKRELLRILQSPVE